MIQEASHLSHRLNKKFIKLSNLSRDEKKFFILLSDPLASLKKILQVTNTSYLTLENFINRPAS
ncbi:hypothetical protein [Streptococcus cuniculipharyngis]|uniref:Uncharacterized protein n=1 Tax=Streptococcus cuniculipharyngis TaxID=1562651 RepID=A0A5C5SBH4_9STRE|nr:hypothetical protein [Streptococcus cuniculipharyngis]TWS98116.1 hypothetical protein FRX57_04095 [Streptococcus cuniculipharyngis]